MSETRRPRRQEASEAALRILREDGGWMSTRRVLESLKVAYPAPRGRVWFTMPVVRRALRHLEAERKIHAPREGTTQLYWAACAPPTP